LVIVAQSLDDPMTTATSGFSFTGAVLHQRVFADLSVPSIVRQNLRRTPRCGVALPHAVA
jgi:hypothetical protein